MRAKPHPGVFLRTAWMLGVQPEECIGVEDAAAGILAIKAARMYAIGIGAIPALAPAGADAVIPNIAALAISGYLGVVARRPGTPGRQLTVTVWLDRVKPTHPGHASRIEVRADNRASVYIPARLVTLPLSSLLSATLGRRVHQGPQFESFPIQEAARVSNGTPVV